MIKPFVLLFPIVLFLVICTPNLRVSAAEVNCAPYIGMTKVWWDGMELKPGQIGRLTVKQDTPLFKLEGEKRIFSRTLKAGEFYRIYAFKPGMLSVGGGFYVDRDVRVTYQTPSKTKLLAVKCINGSIPEAATNDLIIINKTKNQMVFINNGYIEMMEPVATGRSWDLTPIGHFKVVNKVENRPYYKENIPGGAPNNPLGARWLGINVPGSWSSENGHVYAIHGNSNPNSIGKYVSSGCVRMYNDSVIELYNKAAIGTPVAITASERSFEDLAKLYDYPLKGYKVN